jgi:hypothetical protein
LEKSRFFWQRFVLILYNQNSSIEPPRWGKDGIDDPLFRTNWAAKIMAGRNNTAGRRNFFERCLSMTGRRLSTDEKKEIFSHLVAVQDAKHNVRQSYEIVTEHFAISEEQLKAIEEEGIDNEWPPLSESVASH